MAAWQEWSLGEMSVVLTWGDTLEPWMRSASAL
jgi:hypothetical protein